VTRSGLSRPRLAMGRAMLTLVPVVYVVDDSRIGCLQDFWVVMGEAANGPGGYFGQNLDAFKKAAAALAVGMC